MKRKFEFESRLYKQFKNHLAVWAAVLLLCPAAANNVVSAAVVTSCTETNLRAAMAGGGTVTFACDGTITLSNAIAVTQDTVLDGTGHQINVSGNNSVRVFYVAANVNFSMVNLTIANGFSTNGAGIFNDGGLLTLSGVAFQTNVAQTSTGPAPEGGGIFNRAGTINATNCVFTGNLASAPATNYNEAHGGAIRNESGLVNLENCSLTANQACGGGGVAGTAPGGNGDGGAIHNSGSLSVSSCRFTQNSAAGGPGAYDLYDIGWNGSTPGGAGSGAAIFNSGVATIKGGMFSGNAAAGGAGGSSFYPRTGLRGGSGSGGAIYNYGSLVVQDSAFLANSALGGGGGAGGGGGWHISLSGGGGGDGGDGSGGAICNLGSSVIQSSSIVSNTSVGGFGGPGGAGVSLGPLGGPVGIGGNGGNGGSGCGGIWGFVQMTNCTVALNYGYGGSGGHGGAGGYSPPPGSSGASGANGAYGVAAGGLSGSGSWLINTLLAGNTPTNCSGVITDLGHNLSSDGSCNFTNIGSMNNTDPKLGPLADNGGPTLTMRLLPGSPAIDAGDNAAAPPTDQRGFPRPVGLAADIGACECGPPAITTSPPTQTAELNSTICLWVDIAGEPAMSYLWFCNGTDLIGSSTNCELDLTNCQFSRSGTYTIVVTNLYGAVSSAPFQLNIIPPVERRPVPGINLTGDSGSMMHLDYANTLYPVPDWSALDSVTLTGTSELYFDLTKPLPPLRFYRVWQTVTPSVVPSLTLPAMIPAITLTGNTGDQLRLDCINQFGPTDAWVTLDTVTLTNTSQLYFDVSAIGQPPRLYRIVPMP